MQGGTSYLAALFGGSHAVYHHMSGREYKSAYNYLLPLMNSAQQRLTLAWDAQLLERVVAGWFKEDTCRQSPR